MSKYRMEDRSGIELLAQVFAAQDRGEALAEAISRERRGLSEAVSGWKSSAPKLRAPCSAASPCSTLGSQEIAERHAAGETMRELALDYDGGEATIWRALRSLGRQK